MHEKLVRLGFTYYDGTIVVVEPEEEGKNVYREAIRVRYQSGSIQ